MASNNSKLVFQYPDQSAKVARYMQDVDARKTQHDRDFASFIDDWNIQLCSMNVARCKIVEQTSSALTYWAENSSRLCQNCQSIQFCNLLPSFIWKNRPKARQACACKRNHHVISRFNEILESLKGLTAADIKVLRPFHIDCGQYRWEEHGYRVKSGMINLETSKVPVLDNIKAVQNKNYQHRCMEACNF